MSEHRQSLSPQTSALNTEGENSHFDSPPLLLHSDSTSDSSSNDGMMIDQQESPVSPCSKKSLPVDSQTELRKRIMAIQSNPALSPAEKAKQVQVNRFFDLPTSDRQSLRILYLFLI